jgi:Flp pilus assembly protein TadG
MMKQQRGVAMVEFGLLMVPMIMIAFGITEFGRAIFQYNTLTKATRDAVRYLSTQSPGAGFVEAQDLAYCGKYPCAGAPPLVPGLTPAMIVICDSTNSSGSASPSSQCMDMARDNVNTGSEPINLVTVKIEGFVFDSIIDFSVGGNQVGLGGITFDTVSNTMRQVL